MGVTTVVSLRNMWIGYGLHKWYTFIKGGLSVIVISLFTAQKRVSNGCSARREELLGKDTWAVKLG